MALEPRMKVTPTPTPTPTSSASGSKLDGLMADLGITVVTPTTTSTGTTKKPLKSGVYTSTTISRNVPADSNLIKSINDTFQTYYGRDANQSEIQEWLPAIQAQYKDKTGASKTTIKSTYKNGNLISTEYLTADNADPKVWLEDKVKAKVATGQVAINKQNIPEGPAGKYFVTVKNLAAQNGISLSDTAAFDYATKITSGVIDANTAYNTIRESAANAFPSLADKIKQGIDLKTLADPYIQSMSNILEIPDTSIDLFNPTVRSALAVTLPDGKVGSKSIYDFEKDLKKDPRWQYTNNAREQAASVATNVLKDFGFMG